MNRARWWALRAGALALAAGWLMGLSGGGGETGSEIPIPQENFTVTISDANGRSLQARRFTWEGKVFFRAQYGSATVTLPFSKIKSVTVAPEEKTALPAQIHAKITLKTGESVDVTLDRTTKCYGETKFGNYEIFMKDVSSIAFE
jgi:hypothetical protein